jgi:hypothetical protein
MGAKKSSTPTLSSVLNKNNATDGSNIVVSSGDQISIRPRGSETFRADGYGYVTLAAPDADPGASNMPFTSSVSFYIDEVGNNLMCGAQYSDGTNRTGTVCALA